MDFNKIQLRRLAGLENEKSKQYLLSVALTIKDSILKTKDNDKIVDLLDVLEVFCYRVPNVALEVASGLILNDKPYKARIHKTKWGDIERKNYNHVILKSLDILKEIRYMETEKVFDVLVILYNHENEEVKVKSKEILKSLVKYNYFAINKIGYMTQRIILNRILSWNSTDKLANLDVLLDASERLLELSFDGTSMKDERTMIFHRGVLSPNDFLAAIRKDTLRVLFDIYFKANSLKDKNRILQVIGEASVFPMDGECGEDLEHMVNNDASLIIDGYNKILFNSDDKIQAPLPVILTLDKQLIRFIRNNLKEQASKNTFKKIRDDKFYNLSRILIGDCLDYSIEDKDWRDVTEEINREIDKLIDGMSRQNVKELAECLNNIAANREDIDKWEFRNFENFLQRIAIEKTEFAELILEDAFDKNSPILCFVGCFLIGFRKIKRFDLYDGYVEKGVQAKNIRILQEILLSYNVNAEDINEFTRESDIDLVESIINGSGKFEFLADTALTEGNYSLQFYIFQALVNLYKKDKKRVERLIILNIKKSDIDRSHMYINVLELSLVRGYLDFKNWNKKNLGVIFELCVNVDNLEYHTQELLLEIGKCDFDSMMSVFIKRITKSINKKTSKKVHRLYEYDRYDPVPYNFNPDLSKFIKENSEYIETVLKWTKKMTSKSTIYNWELGQFVDRIGGIVEVANNLIVSGQEKDLKKALDLFGLISSPDYDLCLKIVEKTEGLREKNRKDLWELVKIAIARTGVVSGEYGLAEAFEKKYNLMEKMRDRYKNNKLVLKFLDETMQDLDATAKRERQRTEEGIKLRKIDFED